MVNARRVEGRIIIVAGATGSIGRATCASLLSGGATVIAVGRDPRELHKLEDTLRPPPLHFHPAPEEHDREGAQS